jgi:hypothetical protein
MKKLEEILPKLNAQEKAWIRIGPKYHEQTVEIVRQRLRRKTGEDVDPASIKEYLKTIRPKRGAASPQSAARRNIEEQLVRDAKKAEREGNFDPKNIRDGRQKALRGINLRRGQLGFRNRLLEAYSCRCAITNCDCPDTLEAAHILSYRGEDTNHVQNGLLLRSDIHTLFDMGKIGIDPTSHKVIVSESLNGTIYEKLKRRRFRPPSRSGDRPNKEVLRKHLAEWGLKSPSASSRA